MWQTIIDFMFNFIKGLGDFATWLTSEIFKVGDLSVTPLSIFSLGTFVVIISLWVIKLLNPLS